MKKRCPHYGESGFCVEYLFLHRQPRTINDVHRQLACLGELGKHLGGWTMFWEPAPSKRRTRLLRQYWAMCEQESGRQKSKASVDKLPREKRHCA